MINRLIVHDPYERWLRYLRILILGRFSLLSGKEGETMLSMCNHEYRYLYVVTYVSYPGGGRNKQPLWLWYSLYAKISDFYDNYWFIVLHEFYIYYCENVVFFMIIIWSYIVVSQSRYILDAKTHSFFQRNTLHSICRN